MLPTKKLAIGEKIYLLTITTMSMYTMTMPNITVYLTEDQYLKWIDIPKENRKVFIEWALVEYQKRKEKQEKKDD